MTTEEILDILKQNPDLANEILPTLDTLEEFTIRKKYGIYPPISNNRIGQELNLSRERVRQIVESAFNKLRHHTRTSIIRSYLQGQSKGIAGS